MGWEGTSVRERPRVPDLDPVVGGQQHRRQADVRLAAPGQQVPEEGKRAAPRRGDDLPTVGVDDREWPVLGDRLDEDRAR